MYREMDLRPNHQALPVLHSREAALRLGRSPFFPQIIMIVIKTKSFNLDLICRQRGQLFFLIFLYFLYIVLYVESFRLFK